MPADDPMARHLRMLSSISTALTTIVDAFAEPPVAALEFNLEAWMVLIEDVLADHHPTTSSHSRNKDQSLRVICHHDPPAPAGNFPDAQGWRDHVITIIKRRLQTAAALMNSQTDGTAP